MFHISCPCGKALQIGSVDAGRVIRCGCGRDLEVPSLGQLRREAAEGGTLPPPPPPAKHDWKMWWWGVGITVVGFVAQLAGYYFAFSVDGHFSPLTLLGIVAGYLATMVGSLIIGLGKGFSMGFCLLLLFVIPYGSLILLFFPGKGMDKEA